MKGAKNSNCRLCGVGVNEMPGEGGEKRRQKLERHVRAVHSDFDLS